MTDMLKDYGIKIVIIILTALLLTGGAWAVPVKEWDRTFGGTGVDSASSVQQTIDGGYVLAGQTASFGAGNLDAWLIKTDALGNEQWNKTFGGEGEDAAFSVLQTQDGGYVLAGQTASFGAGSWDAWLIKTDALGNEQWNKTFGGTGTDNAFSVQQTQNGDYILAGVTYSFGATVGDAWLIKTDALGNEMWNKRFGGTGSDVAEAVRLTSDGGIIIAGATNSFGAGNYDAWLLKTDATGNELWNKTFGGAGSDAASSVQQTSDGSYIISGWTTSFGAGDVDAWLIKTDVQGNELWNKTYGGTGLDETTFVQQTSEGNFILTGATNSFGSGGLDVWLIRTDVAGNELWNKTFGGTGVDMGSSIQQTQDGGFIISGETYSFGAGEADAWLIKVGELKGGVDTIPPEIRCIETVNPHGMTIPPAGGSTPPGINGGQNEDGFYELVANDNIDPNPDIFVVDTGSGMEFGPFARGIKIKYTQASGVVPGEKKIGSASGQAGVITWHITGTGDAAVFAVDFSGNKSPFASCRVPPLPK